MLPSSRLLFADLQVALRQLTSDSCGSFGGALRPGKNGDAPEPVLTYRISVPSSPLSELFRKLLSWGHPGEIDDEGGFCIDGELTRQQAAQVVLDIEHIDDTLIYPEPLVGEPKIATATRQSTLRELLDGLNPRFQ